MIASRTFRLANILNKSSKAIQCSFNNVTVRNCHGKMGYRKIVTATDKQFKVAELLGMGFWGWIFYHIINDYEMLLGEYYTPNPELWTDEELGIPPDEVGPYVPK